MAPDDETAGPPVEDGSSVDPNPPAVAATSGSKPKAKAAAKRKRAKAPDRVKLRLRTSTVGADVGDPISVDPADVDELLASGLAAYPTDGIPAREPRPGPRSTRVQLRTSTVGADLGDVVKVDADTAAELITAGLAVAPT